MTALVEQRCASDCAIAAAAMATGKSYDEVLDAAGEHYEPEKGTRRVGAILEALGLSNDDFMVQIENWALSPKLYQRMIWGRRALVTVPSLNIENGSHMIYYDGRDVYDPNPATKRRYTDFGQLQPSEIVTFRERA